jgi:hypothetical protein
VFPQPLPATSGCNFLRHPDLRPSELFPGPALLRCQCIRNSIDCERVRAGQKK